VRVIGAILLAGIVLVLSAPLIALTPVFAPPPNGCPCPGGIDVTTPFTNAGIAVGIVGVALTAFAAVKWQSFGFRIAGEANNRTVVAVAFAGVVLLIVAMVLSQIDLTGPGWSILLYSAQGFYLGTLGVGVLLFSGFTLATRSAIGASLLSTGIVLCGISLLFSYGLSSDFSTRCFPEVGCSPALAASTVSDMIILGYVLAIGAFSLALGLAFSFISRRRTTRPQNV